MEKTDSCKHCGRVVRVLVGPGHYIHSEFDPASDVDDRTSLQPYKHNAALARPKLT